MPAVDKLRGAVAQPDNIIGWRFACIPAMTDVITKITVSIRLIISVEIAADIRRIADKIISEILLIALIRHRRIIYITIVQACR